MSGHTKVPWRYERSRDGTAIVFGGPGCTFPVMESPVEATEFYTEERHANARLIAAAPEMLEALKVVWDRPNGLSAQHFAHIAAIIAKAEGQS